MLPKSSCHDVLASCIICGVHSVFIFPSSPEHLKWRCGGYRPARALSPSAYMGFLPENQVRTRLPTGGRRIRTTGPSRVEYLCFDWFCRLEGWKKPVQKSPPSLGGTGSSNPSSSTGESVGDDLGGGSNDPLGE